MNRIYYKLVSLFALLVENISKHALIVLCLKCLHIFWKIISFCYSQKLAFSDDESSEPAASPAPIRESSRESSQSQSNRITHSSSAPPPSTITNDAQTNQRQISPSPGKVKSASIEKNIEDSNNANSGSGASRGPMWSSRNTQSRDVDYRQNGHQRNAPRNVLEDDEIWIQRRKQTHERIERAQELAKLRREEEDRKFMETKMAANKKLLELEQKISAKKNSTSQDGVKDSASDNTINSSSNQDSHSNSGMHQLQGSVSSDGLEFRQMSQIGNGGPSSVSGRGFVQWNASVQEQQSAGGDRGVLSILCSFLTMLHNLFVYHIDKHVKTFFFFRSSSRSGTSNHYEFT